MTAPGQQPHVATIDFEAFYADTAGGIATAVAFYQSLTYSGSEARRLAKIMLNQAARMVWLGDETVNALARDRPAIQIMFYMIAAEAVGKLAVGYEGDADSRKHVRLFFTRFLTSTQRAAMRRALEWAAPRPPDSPDELVDYLYDLRCDVVHEGRYFEMTVPEMSCIDAVRRVLLEGVWTGARDVAEQGVRAITAAEEAIVSRKRGKRNGATR